MPAGVTIVAPELAAFATLMKRAPEKTKEVLSRRLGRAAIIVQRYAIKEAPTDLGNMRSKIGIFNMPGGEIAIGPRSNYALFVHEGTRPHKVSGRALEGWARRKGLNPYAVAASIARKGTKANPFMSRAAKAATSEVRAELAAGVDEVAQWIERG